MYIQWRSAHLRDAQVAKWVEPLAFGAVHQTSLKAHL